MKNKYKTWFCSVAILVLGACSLVGFVNWLVDPLWMFNHRVPIGNYQELFNERQQKTNLLVHKKPVIKTLLVGSSWTLYTHVDLYGEGTFNYAVSGMLPVEYKISLQNVVSQEQKLLQMIIGLDFFGASKIEERTDITGVVDAASVSDFKVAFMTSISFTGERFL